MHERELRAFVLVADAGDPERAAATLGSTQPAVSYQITCLEQTLGVRLFTRGPDRFRLTEEGRLILPSARAALALLEGIRSRDRDRPERSGR